MENLIYPVDLVREFGAKAGINNYIANELPEIPQAKNIVKIPSESIDSALERAEAAGIGWPRIFRSSAEVELWGYEGVFPTKTLGSYDKKKVKNIVNKIENSFKNMNVIIAEQSPSECVGTYIKHPNRDDFYIVDVTDVVSLRLSMMSGGFFPKRQMYISSKGNIFPFDTFGKGDFNWDLNNELKEVISWHDKIVQLPKLDEGWTWQVEFGLNPQMLYQFRPFKLIEKADFKLPQNEFSFIVGKTKKSGIEVKIKKYPYYGTVGDSGYGYREKDVCFYGDFCYSEHAIPKMPNLKANIFNGARNFLEHTGISALRKAEVSIFMPSNSREFKHNSWVNIKSDGYNFEINPIDKKD